MLKCSWFIIYMILGNGMHTVSTAKKHKTPAAKINRVNIDLETYVDVDEEVQDADLKLSIQNQKLSGDIKFIIHDEHDLRRDFDRKVTKRFTEFIANAVSAIRRYNDKNLKHFFTLFNEEIRKYHYRGCMFYQLTKIPTINKLIDNKLRSVADSSVENIRITLIQISKLVDKFNNNKIKEELFDLINSLYTTRDMPNFKKFLVNIEVYNIYDGKTINLRKIIREAARSIIFDHYTKLPKVVKVELKQKIEEYFENIIKSLNSRFGGITNSMVLDFQVNDENKDDFSSYETKKTKFQDGKKRLQTGNKMKKIYPKYETNHNFSKFANKVDTQEITKTSSFQKQTNEDNTFTNKPTIEYKQYTDILRANKATNENKVAFVTEELEPKEDVTSNRANAKLGFIEVVTMRPFVPRKSTSFGKFHYVMETVKHTKNPSQFSTLRAKVNVLHNKIPGILFNKGDNKIQVVDLKQVRSISLPENKKIPRGNNTIDDDEGTLIYYRRNMNKVSNIEPKEIIVYPSIRTKKEKLNKYLRKHNQNKFINKMNKSISKYTGHVKPNERKDIQILDNLRINVDDYIKRMNTSHIPYKMNSRRQFNIKPKYNLNRRSYTDAFIRGKGDPQEELKVFLRMRKENNLTTNPTFQTKVTTTQTTESTTAFISNTKPNNVELTRIATVTTKLIPSPNSNITFHNINIVNQKSFNENFHKNTSKDKVDVIKFDGSGTLKPNMRFSIESRKNTTLSINITTAQPNTIIADKDIKHKRESKWSKLKMYIFNNTFTANKTNVNETEPKLGPNLRANENDYRVYTPDIATVEVFNPINDVTASGDFEKLEKIVNKQDKEDIWREIMERKAKREMKVESRTTSVDMLIARRAQDDNLQFPDEVYEDNNGSVNKEPTFVPPPPKYN